MKISGTVKITLLVTTFVMSSLIAACSSDDEATPSPTATLSDPSPSPTLTPTPSPESTLAGWTGDPIVETLYGTVKGFDDESNTWVWKAIPFAKPPVGELRWKAPQNPDLWDGVREETQFGSMCSQYDPLAGETVNGSEDCLYLNVWRPQSDETNLPVYVWIHGGGNSTGWATHTPTYYGTTLAQQSNMVFVSVNYRLGPLGWFTHPALKTGDELDDSGNYGTLDLIKALEWIQDNIEAFGGDPDKVIITGESSGAVNVLSLLLSPPAEGLFHRALVQSGMIVSTPVSDGEASSEEVLLKLLVNDGAARNHNEAVTYIENMSDAEIAEYLRGKSPTDILACYDQKGFGMVIITEIIEDGNVIVDEGADAFDSGAYPNKVPIMVGSTKEEQKMFLYRDPFFEGKEELYQTVASYGSALWKANGVDGLARKVSENPEQPDIYAYQFNWGAYIEDGSSPIPEPYDLKIGSAHSLDIPFFLGNHSFNVFMTNWVFTEENRPGREALSDAMMAYVAQFARTGNPNAPESDLPEWKPWNNGIQEPKCILFNAGLDTARIEMSDQEYSISNVLESMKTEVPEPLYSETFEWLSLYRTTSGLTEENE